jgi:alkaline phosphatase D
MKRRQWHRAALALALQPWLQTPSPAQPAPGTPRWQRNPFSLGVASGQPRPDAVVLWTRLMPDSEEFSASSQHQTVIVSYEIYSDEALRQPVQRGQVTTGAARAHSVHVDVRGLRPDRFYWYRFVCGEAVSPVGRTRTAPAADARVARLRLALASCQHYEQGWFAAHREIARQDLDLVLFVGDYIYESTNPSHKVAPGVREHTGGIPTTLDGYRQRYALYKSDPDLRAAHAAHPWVVTWDDHEVVNDYASDQDARGNAGEAFLQRRAAAYQAYFEHMPVRLGPEAPGSPFMRIHDQMAWGQLAELWTLDCRQYRSPQACPDPLRGGGRMVLGCEALVQPQRTMLGAAQERWLGQGLAASQRSWKLVAQATQISPSGIDSPLGRTTYTDAWDGYPAARARLLQTVADARLADVVTLGGDVHMNVAAQLRLWPNDERSPVLASEIVTTSISSRGMSDAVLQRIRAGNPDIAYARADERGYTRVEVTPQGVSAEFRTTPYPAAADARLGTQARFAIARGRAGIEQA